VIRLFPKGLPARAETRATRDELMGGWSIVRGVDVPDVQRSGNEARLAWERHPVVNACARAIVDILAAVPLQVVSRDDEPEPLPDHPAQRLLDHPRPGLSGQRLRARTGMGFLLYGNALWHLERRGARGLPVGIRPVNAERLQYVYTNLEDDVVAYDWRGLSDMLMQTPVADMVHFRDLEARDGLMGYPRGAAALVDIDTDTKATNYVRQMVTNHGVPGLGILTDGAVSPDDLQAAEAKWHEKMSVRGERGRTKFLAGVKDIKQIGFDLSQLEFPDLRGIAREDICAAFAVDPRIIGLQSAGRDGGLSGEQYREARFRLIQQAVLPVMKAIESELDHWFAPEFGEVAIRFHPDVLSELTENEAETSERVRAEVASGLRTVEEGRTILGAGELDAAHHFALGPVALKQVKAALTDAETTAAEQAERAAALAAATKPPPEEQAA
jgi:HK97 family phage portal protein